MATRKIFHRRGYAALYASQLRELRGDRDQIRIMTILLVTSWVSILVIAFYRGLTHREPDLLSAISFFLAFPVISALVYFPIWTIYASGDPARAAPGIALDLLLFAPRPYNEGQGLGRKDLEHLKAMAQAEQSSAEWRGGLLTNLIVALVVAMVAGDIALQLPPASLRAAIGAISPLPVRVFAFPFGMYLLIASAAIVLFIRLFWRFNFSELPNRALLFACEEAIALLEACNIPAQSSLDRVQTQQIATMFGYELVKVDPGEGRDDAHAGILRFPVVDTTHPPGVNDYEEYELQRRTETIEEPAWRTKARSAQERMTDHLRTAKRRGSTIIANTVSCIRAIGSKVVQARPKLRCRAKAVTEKEDSISSCKQP
jgi:hypothetical protein